MKIITIILLVLAALYIGRIVLQNTTSPAHIGHKDGKLAAMPDKPNAVSSQTEILDKQVAPLPFKGSREETLEAAINALNSMGNNALQVQESDYLYSIFSTKLLHFNDDVEILLDEQQQLLHFRSQSRAGYSDLGVNRQRYEDFKALYLP